MILNVSCLCHLFSLCLFRGGVDNINTSNDKANNNIDMMAYDHHQAETKRVSSVVVKIPHYHTSTGILLFLFLCLLSFSLPLCLLVSKPGLLLVVPFVVVVVVVVCARTAPLPSTTSDIA
jgi:hypothetical protein